jgi:hypothetical protein
MVSKELKVEKANSQEYLQQELEKGIATVAEVDPSSRQDFASTETSAPSSAAQPPSSANRPPSSPPSPPIASSLLPAGPTIFHPIVTMQS